MIVDTDDLGEIGHDGRAYPVSDEPSVVPEKRTAPKTWPVAVLGAAALVVFAGIALRFWTHSHLWLDEALTVNVARLPLSAIPDALRHDGAPPLYYFLLHGWMRVFGTSDSAVRALSGVFAVLALPLMWAAGRRVGNSGEPHVAGAVAVLLLASSPFAIQFATETRMYSLVTLLTLAGYLALTRALDTDAPRWPELVPLAALSGLLLLTHYWSLYLLATVGVMLGVKSVRGSRRQRRSSRLCLMAIVSGGVFFIPWLPYFAFQLRHTGTPWAVPASFSAMVNAVSQFGGGRSSSGRALALTFFALIGFGLFGAAIDHVRIEIDLRTRPRARGLAICVLGTLALAIAVGLATEGAFAARYTAIVFAPFLLLVTLGATVLIDHPLLSAIVAAAAVFGFITASGNVTADRTQAAQLATVIERQMRPGDVVGYCPDQLGPAMSRLLPPGVRQVTFPSSISVRRPSPQFVDWVDYAKRTRSGDPAAFATDLDREAGSDHTVWLVWASQYRTLGAKCEAVSASLTTLRPNANQLIEADTQHFFEHANLVRYLPR